MKRIVKLVLILGTFFMLSCMDMYNEVAEETGTEYNCFLAVASSYNGNINVYSLNESGSQATLVDTKTDYTSRRCGYIAAHPSGDYLYVTDTASNTIYVYKAGSNGLLTITQEFNAGHAAYVVKVDPTGKYLYSASNSANTLKMFLINSSGLLSSPVPDNTISAGVTSPTRFVLDTTNGYLFVVGSTYAARHIINTDGTLTEGFSFNLGKTTYDVIVDSNNHLYVSYDDTDDKISGWSISSLSSSSNLSSTITTYTSTHWSRYLAINPSGKNLYYSWTAPESLQINPDGTLTELLPATYPSVGGATEEIVYHPNGNYVYLNPYGASGLKIASIDSNGVTAEVQDINGLVSPRGLALIRKKK